MGKSHKDRFYSWCGASNKQDKKLANKRFRAVSKQLMLHGKEPIHSLDECSNIFTFSKDGPMYYAKDLDGRYDKRFKK